MVKTVLERQLGSERPAHQPDIWQFPFLDEFHRRGNIMLFGDAVAKLALAHSARALGAPSVEAQHRDVGESGQTVSCFAQDVRIHETAGGRQRMQRHDGCHGITLNGHGQLADKGEPIARVQFDFFAVGRELDSASYFDHLARHLPAVRVPMTALFNRGVVAKHVIGSPCHKVCNAGGNLERASRAGICLCCGSRANRLNNPLGSVPRLRAPCAQHEG